MAFRFFSSKVYSVLPRWQKPIYRDPFDYPLRSLEEVKAEIANDPPIQRAEITLTHHFERLERSIDTRDNKVKLKLNMEDWKLTQKQKERLIFLLGPRYKNSPYFKVVTDSYPTREQNYQKAMDILHELYMESKRAP